MYFTLSCSCLIGSKQPAQASAAVAAGGGGGSSLENDADADLQARLDNLRRE